VSDDILRQDSTAINMFEPSDLAWLKAYKVSVDSVNRLPPLQHSNMIEESNQAFRSAITQSNPTPTPAPP
jgi:hypothetical protein